ncbi:hypothetical protein [Nannocystis sp. SCPEA4]|uniref:hypothetical protein n=1 Tax=Nannocystis sp. SCPEA4 TaxID=2996787 RepID=UPI0022710544|nr:hypothetical protein [Nannocystis sp. SCPEA4]MCY1055650.1 hypothetical protein [Nannocystis sp. SCPEA4]
MPFSPPPAHRRRILLAALTVLLASPSLAGAKPPPVAEFDESPAPPSDVLHPDLAADAPQADWIREGYGAGAGVEQDPRALNRKIRRAGRVTLAGGAIAILGGTLAITGAILLYGVRPKTRLQDLAKDNGGSLPTDDEERHRLISIARAGPIVAFTGLGVLVGGVVTAAVARLRLKKLRERRRTSIVSVSPTMFGHGAEVHWEVRF